MHFFLIAIERHPDRIARSGQESDSKISATTV
jgi:hypothetical protein